MSEIPLRSSHRNAQTSFTSAETEIIEIEIAKMLDKGVIGKVAHEPNEIVSNIFCKAEKRRHSQGHIEFNKYISYYHFRMESLTTIIKLVDKNCFMACIDLKDAYYSIPIRKSDRKYLKFQWNNTLYQYTCLPNGLSSGPRKFTKILKPPLASLHTKGHIISGHLDDIYLQGKTSEKCRQNVIDSVTLFTRLGLLVHPDKSIFTPQSLVILGFEISSVSMHTVRLTRKKAQAIKLDSEKFIHKSERKPIIREVAQIVAKLVSSFPGVLFGPLYYRSLEKGKSKALASNPGNFDGTMRLSPQAIAELNRWSANVLDACNLNPFHAASLAWLSQPMLLKQVGGQNANASVPEDYGLIQRLTNT